MKVTEHPADITRRGLQAKRGNAQWHAEVSLWRITALIPIDNLPSLKDSWLVLQVKVQRDGVVGTTYAHGNKLALD